MGKRRQSREFIVQFLYQTDMNKDEIIDECLSEFWKKVEAPADIVEFSSKMIGLVFKNKDEIDAYIKKATTNWDLKRIAVVDRNILRLGIGELLYADDIPPVVSINEAVDIAKKFGTEESGKFVNGILDQIRMEIEKK